MTSGNSLQAAASALVIQSIERKRSGLALDCVHLQEVVGAFIEGLVPDYQIAAWLATVACMGLDADEVAALTVAYVASDAERLTDIHGRPIADKHSTGGVGDKTTLVVAPVVAACGIPFAKMSGRGLGFAGGTIDKLESIPGLRLELSREEVQEALAKNDLVIASQSPTLAPGDGATYRIRDVSGTVASIPLIAASIMSKKLALGATLLVLDVKAGSGALLPDNDDALALAETMEAIAASCGIRARAILSNMNQPLGYAVGNELEVVEAMKVLHGEHVRGLSELSERLAAAILQMNDSILTEQQAVSNIRRCLETGAALECFYRWIGGQGGDIGWLSNLYARAQQEGAPILAQRAGWVTGIAPREIGSLAVQLGAGRLTYTDRIDHSAGVLLTVALGDRVEKGQPIAFLYGRPAQREALAPKLADAIAISDEAPTSLS